MATNEVTYNLVNEFRGYLHKLDITNLQPGYLIPPSVNVLSTPGNRVGNRKGWTLDGQSDSSVAGIDASFEYLMHTGQERPLRAGNSKHQVRYVASAGDYYNGTTFTANQVYWLDLQTGLTSTALNYVDYWDITNVQSLVLWVNGAASITEWTGGITTMLSATAATITKNGSTTWAEEGFYTTGTHSVIINGTTYQATGGWGTTTLTGVTPSPAAEVVNSVVMQAPETTLNGAMTSMGLTGNDIIGIRNNQVYVGQFINRSVYVSKVNDYKNYSFTSPQRITREGGLLTLDSNVVGFINQEAAMYITAGKRWWYETKFTIQGDNGIESLSVEPLKTSSQQAAQSQALITKSPNDVIFVTNEPTLSSLGRIANVVLTPQILNISDPIKLDFDDYDFTGGSVFYDRYFYYVAIPADNTWLIFNVAKNYWEPPQTGDFSRFSVIGGELYGHSSLVPETYKMFDGYNDNGAPISNQLAMAWNNFGKRAKTKRFDEVFVEGYITSNGSLTLTNQYDIDGCMTQLTATLDGGDTQFVCLPSSDGSLGVGSLGTHSLGTGSSTSSLSGLPPKFRWIPTFQNPGDFYEWSPIFSSSGVDFNWELLCFGPNVQDSSTQDTSRKD